MIKQMIQKAKIKFFVPEEVAGPVTHLPAGYPAPTPVTLLYAVRPLTAEQQRIELLETQNQQLRAEIVRCRNSSIGFAHEMRRLLTD